ncbi:MAG: hypothetical protein P0Y62_06825 [Candidatus Chryseobacterium colombiense]|nr:hypothetical protein [Chryseobacterium sp.]WEK71265.1 MAG: hypothetical protein P0Y62_06825 [Chryseobacterium sp.]
MDIKYAYYNTSKGYRVLGGTAVHFLKADGSLDGTEYIDKTSFQDITGIKSFNTYLGGDVVNNRLWVRSSDGSNPAMSFTKDGVDNAQLAFSGYEFQFVNTNSTGYFPVKANGYTKNGSSDSYVLTGGGGHKAISDFATQNQLNNYIPLTGTGDFTGAIKNPNSSIQFGNDGYYKAFLNLYDTDNPNFPNQELTLGINTEEGFYFYRNNASLGTYTNFNISNSTINFGVEEGGVFTELELSNGGLFGNYKVPTQDGSYIQKKYVDDNISSATSSLPYVPLSGTLPGKPLTDYIHIEPVNTAAGFFSDNGTIQRDVTLTDDNGVILNAYNVSNSTFSSVQTYYAGTRISASNSILPTKYINVSYDQIDTKGKIIGEDYENPTDDLQYIQKKYITDNYLTSTGVSALLANYYTKSETYNKAEVDAKLSAVYRPKGSVANFASLPTPGNTEGDVWNVLDTGANYVWVTNVNNTGIPGWDKLSETVDLTNYVTINTGQTIEAHKTFNGATDNSYTGAAIMVNGNGNTDTIFPTIAFHQPTLYAATMSYRSDGRFHFMNIDAGTYVPIAANGFQKSGSSDSYVLLGGTGHKLLSDFALATDLSGYVTLTTEQNIFAQKTFATYYDTYTSDGLFSSDAKPLRTTTPSGNRILLGYKDYGGGQYYPRIGFKNTGLTNWSMGPLGNDFVIGVNNDGAETFKIRPSGATSKNQNNTQVFNRVYQGYFDVGTNQGILAIKMPQASIDQAMFSMDINIYGYSNQYIGKAKIAFYKYLSGAIIPNGGTALLEVTDNFPTTTIRVGIGSDGYVSILFGDPNTVWEGYMSFEVARVQVQYGNWYQDWSSGWAHGLESSLTQYGSNYITLPTEVVATRSWTNTELSGYLTNRGVWNQGSVAHPTYPLAITDHAGDPSTTGFQSYYGTSFHFKGPDTWYNRLDFPTNAEKLFLYQGINTTDMSLRGYIDLISAGATNWTSNNFNPASYVTQNSLNSQLSAYATLNGVQTFTNTNVFNQSPIIPQGTLDSHAVNLAQLINGNVATAGSLRNINISLAQLNSMDLQPGIYNAEGYSIGQGLTATYHYIIQLGSYTSGGYRAQIAIPYSNGINDSIYIRTSVGNTWGNFERIAKNTDITTALSNYALSNGSNASDTWANAAKVLATNPYVSGRTMNSAGTVHLNEATYGDVHGFLNSSGTAQGNPTDSWFHRIKMLHDNSSGYFTEIAVQMTGGYSMWYKKYENGDANAEWVELWDKKNFNPDSKDSAWLHSGRDFTQGTRILTNIDYSQTQGAAFLLEIKGNMYGGGMVMDCKVQGYIYNNTIINVNGYSTHPLLTEIIALNLNGELCFWFPRLSYWQGFSVKVTDVTSAGVTTTKNRAYQIADASDPGGIKRVSIPIATVATQNWVNGQSFVTTNTVQAITALKEFYATLAIANGQSIYLKGSSDTAHYIRHFSDDTDGFGVSSGFAVKNYSTLENLFQVTSAGFGEFKQNVRAGGFLKTGSSNNFVLLGYGDHKPLSDFWTSANFNPATKVNAWENAYAVGFSSGLSTAAPYIYHATDGYVFLATQSWVSSNFANQIQLNKEFTVNTWSGLIIADDYFGGESGIIDEQLERLVTAKKDGYYFYGSNYGKFDGLNFHCKRQLFGMGREANKTDKLTVEGSVKASQNFKSEDEEADTMFIPDGRLATLRDEIVNEKYAIRLNPHEYGIDAYSTLEVDDRNRLIHIVGEQVEMRVNFNKIYPKQQIVIYNFDQKGNGLEVLINGKTIYYIEQHCFLRLYVTDSLRVIAERQQPCDFVW